VPYCAYCGHEISDAAVSCPNCGHPVGTPIGQPPRAPGTAVGELAGFWIRLGSLIIDGLILFVIEIPFFAATVAAGTRFRDSFFFYNPASFLVSFAYPWLMIALVRGQTLGMMLTGLRITRADGSPVDLGHSAARAGMAIVSRLPLSLGYLWAAWDPEKRTWHDMVADTRVFRTRAPIQRI
jgi:uncharacterized RDD family membrane protein YckC